MPTPKNKLTIDGKELVYSTVPSTGEERWIDFSDSKDFDGTTGYRWYDSAGNKMNYTKYQEADTQEYVPTAEEVDSYIQSRGYDPNLTRPMWGLHQMQEQGLQGVYPEFALLTGGRGLFNGALQNTYTAFKPYASQAWQGLKPGGSFWSTYQKPLTQFAESMMLGEAANEAARINGYNGWGDATASGIESLTGYRPNEVLMDFTNPFYLGREMPQLSRPFTQAAGHTLENWLTGLEPGPLKITEANANGIPLEEWNRQFRAAYNTGNRERGQELWDIWFSNKAKGNRAIDVNGKPLRSYHTVSDENNPNFNAFDTNIEGFDSSIYTTDNPFMSGTYTRELTSEAERDFIIEKTRQQLLDRYSRTAGNSDFIKKQIAIYSNPSKARKKILEDHPWLSGPIHLERQKALYTYLQNPVTVENHGANWNDINLASLPEDVLKEIRVDTRSGYLSNNYSTRSLEKAQKAAGNYDGAIINDVTDYGGKKMYGRNHEPATVIMTNDPKYVKSAEPFTFDDEGNLIDITDRANFAKNDIRYGWIPWLAGVGTAGTLYGASQNNVHAYGGSLNTYKQWQDLPIKERADIMKVAIRNGITNLADIKAKYNEFALGGQLEEPNLYEESDEGNMYSKGSWLRKKTAAISKASKVPTISKKSTPMSNSSAYAMQYFINKGLAPHQAAGLVGNLMRESGLNPLAINPGSKAYGLAQWLGARKKKLFSMYGSKPTLQNQLDFVWWELNNTHKNGLKHLMAARNAEEAARAGMNWFEFSNGDAISEMNKWGQDGRGSMRKGIMYATKLAGQPMPDLSYLDAPNPTMQQPQMYGQMPMGYGYPIQQPQNDNDTLLAFEPSNPQAFFAPLSSYETPVEQTVTQPLVDVAEQQYKAEMAERQRAMQQNNNMLALVSYLNNSDSQDSSPFGVFNLLANSPLASMDNVSAYGGHLYDGESEPTNQMHRVNPRYLSEQVTVEGRNAKVLGADYGRNTATVQYDDGTTEIVRPAKDFWTVPNNAVLGSRELKDNQYRTMPTNSEANALADAWAEQTAPTVGHLIAAGLKPLDLVTPSKYVGLLDSDNKNGFLHLFDEDNRGLFINDNPQGMFSKKYAEEHPYWAMAGNLTGDIATGIAAGWAVGKGLNSANKGSYKGLRNFGDGEEAPFQFEGFKEDPIQMHLKRAQAKGYNTSDINVVDLSKSSPERDAFLKQQSEMFHIPESNLLQFYMDHMANNGHASQLRGTRTIIHDGKGSNVNARISHEIDHLLHTPEESVIDDVFDKNFAKTLRESWGNDADTELAARGSQMHDYLGHTGNEKITKENLEYIRDHYEADTGLHNDIGMILKNTKDLGKLAEWLTKYATGLSLPMLMKNYLSSSENTK